MAAASGGGGGSSATGGGGCGSGGGGGAGGGSSRTATGGSAGGLPAAYTLAFSDIKWDKDADGEKVELGRGASGIVYAGRLDGQAVAIKHEMIDHPDDVAAWAKTVVLRMHTKGPHFAGMYGAVVCTPTAGGRTAYYSVTERLAGTLTALLLKPGGVHYGADMKLRLQLLADVADGLAYLHAASVIHGDVKPDNVLLKAVSRWSPFPIAKLTGFGSTGTRTRGTLVYMDPDLLDGIASITAASDVYSFGVMTWQVLSGLQPYAAELVAAAPATALEAERLLKAHVCGASGKRPPVAVLVGRGVPPAVVALVESCWAPAQASRPAMAEVYHALLYAWADAEASFARPAAASAGLHAAPAAAPLPAAAAAAAAAVAPARALAPAGVVVPAGRASLVYKWHDRVVLRGHSTPVVSLALLPGGRLASGDEGGTVRLWDASRGGEATAVLEGRDGSVNALAALPDGRRLAAGVSADDGVDGAVVVWNMGVAPPTWCATIDCGCGVAALAVLRDGRLAVGCHDGGVRLVDADASAGAMTTSPMGHKRAVAALAVLPDGTLASGSRGRTVLLWDVGAQVCVAKLVGHKRGVYALAVLTDGRLASGSYDMSIRLWDVAARACVGVLEGHTNLVWALAALTYGRLASGSCDETIRVWDTRPAAAAGAAGTRAAGAAAPTGRRTARATPVEFLEGHTGWVVALQPLPGGRLASGSDDGTVCLWQLPP